LSTVHIKDRWFEIAKKSNKNYLQYVSKQSYPFFKTKPQQNLNKITTKSQQNRNKITKKSQQFCFVVILFCFDYVMFYWFELENSLNSWNLLSEYYISLHFKNGKQLHKISSL